MKMDVTAATTARFEALWKRCVSASSDSAPCVSAELVRLYSEPHRRFHTLDHINDCLRRFDEVGPLMKRPEAVELALWFHDAIYKPGARDNEERSAELFARESAGAEAAFTSRVCDLILATKHVVSDLPGDRGFMVDIDLGGFADPWDLFMSKGEDLRAEHATQSDDEYYRSQIKFLSRLERRRYFYCTSYYRSRYEKSAKENVHRLLELRKGEGYGVAAVIAGTTNAAPDCA